MKTIGIEAVLHVSRRMCISGTRGWEAVGWEMALSINETGRPDGEIEVDKILWRQWKVAWSSMVYTEAELRCLCWWVEFCIRYAKPVLLWVLELSVKHRAGCWNEWMSSWKRLLKTDDGVESLEYWVSERLIVGGGIAKKELPVVEIETKCGTFRPFWMSLLPSFHSVSPDD